MDREQFGIPSMVIGACLLIGSACYGTFNQEIKINQTQQLDSVTGKYEPRYYEVEYIPEPLGTYVYTALFAGAIIMVAGVIVLFTEFW